MLGSGTIGRTQHTALQDHRHWGMDSLWCNFGLSAEDLNVQRAGRGLAFSGLSSGLIVLVAYLCYWGIPASSKTIGLPNEHRQRRIIS